MPKKISLTKATQMTTNQGIKALVAKEGGEKCRHFKGFVKTCDISFVIAILALTCVILQYFCSLFPRHLHIRHSSEYCPADLLLKGEYQLFTPFWPSFKPYLYTAGPLLPSTTSTSTLSNFIIPTYQTARPIKSSNIWRIRPLIAPQTKNGQYHRLSSWWRRYRPCIHDGHRPEYWRIPLY